MNNSNPAIDDLINQTECSSSVPTTFTVVLSTVSLLALIGNLLVIITFIRTVNLKTSPNYYIVNMAVSDLVCVILNWPLYATEGMLKAGGSLIADPTIATLFCKLGIYSRAVSYVVSILSLVLIAVDRFIATVFPLKVLKITGCIRKLFLLLSWFLPALGLVPYFVHSEIVEVDKRTFCRNVMSNLAKKIYHLLGFVLFYLVPLILILVLYPLIIKYSRRSRAQADDSGRSAAKAKRDKQNQNVMKILGSIVLAFFICWTPLYVYLFLKSRYPSIFVKDKCLLLVGLFYYIFPLLSTAINPFILISFSSSYRAAVKRLCCACFPKCRLAHFGHITPAGVSSQGQNIELPDQLELKSAFCNNKEN